MLHAVSVMLCLWNMPKNDLKLIQQTPADPASIEVNEPCFDDLNFNLGRMEDTCSLKNVDLPGNQFNKATQVT